MKMICGFSNNICLFITWSHFLTHPLWSIQSLFMTLRAWVLTSWWKRHDENDQNRPEVCRQYLLTLYLTFGETLVWLMKLHWMKLNKNHKAAFAKILPSIFNSSVKPQLLLVAFCIPSLQDKTNAEYIDCKMASMMPPMVFSNSKRLKTAISSSLLLLLFTLLLMKVRQEVLHLVMLQNLFFYEPPVDAKWALEGSRGKQTVQV